ncbi:MAG: hypothetical protein ABSF46_22125 [Terriglobia bacterium]|jgi:hypothetical protein
MNTLELSFTVPGNKMRTSVQAGTRMDALELIFTVAVQRYAEEARLPPSQALQKFCEANPDLWKEYCEQVRELSRRTPSGVRLAAPAMEDKMARKVWTGSNRTEILKRIFTVGVAEYAKENGLPMGEALSGMIEKNRSLWDEYWSDTMPVQGELPEPRASAALASEMNAYARLNHVSLAVALSEVCKSNPDLLRRYREEISIVV